jgi:aryl-alcohol dehydrogenase-like predicted oxidoreductase
VTDGLGIVVVGSLNRDYVCAVDRLPRPGETRLGEELAFFCGGKGGNQAVAASLVGGVHVAMVGAVGDDATWQRAVPGRAVLASTQMEYSLVNRRIESDVVPAAEALGLGILPWSPLGHGVLTGKYRNGIPSDSRGASESFGRIIERYLDSRCQSIIEAVAKAADGLGWSMTEVALTWVRDRPGVTAPIVGARTAKQLLGALAIEELTLPPEIVAALDDVSED